MTVTESDIPATRPAVVLHEEYGEAPLSEAREGLVELRGLVVVEARGGFVEKEETFYLLALVVSVVITVNGVQGIDDLPPA